MVILPCRRALIRLIEKILRFLFGLVRVLVVSGGRFSFRCSGFRLVCLGNAQRF